MDFKWANYETMRKKIRNMRRCCERTEKEPTRDRLKRFKNLPPMTLEETYMNEIWTTIEVRGV